ncbi:putative Ig domain-containing protein [Arcanobacterium phocae]|uniref:putative Ig domain-containing protein n=1 Tax=Arcanobacterium phocae TaxID=131112 RepID=UPI001C0F7DDD|nr:putative Ig domain-containing protein [Arcanobacterium phocae]
MIFHRKGRTRSRLITTTLIVGLFLTPSIASAATTINIPDEHLANCITKALKKPAGSEITDDDVNELIKLTCRRGVTDVTGLGAFTQLVRLDLGENPGLTNVDEIAPLTGLKSLNLQNNTELDNVDVIKNHPTLQKLALNNIGLEDSDLERVIATIPTLTYLAVSNNKIEHVSALTADVLPNLRDIRIASNRVVDLSPLGQSQLTKLYAGGQVNESGPTMYVPARADTFIMSMQRPDILTTTGDNGIVVAGDQYTSEYELGTDTVTVSNLDEMTTQLGVKFQDPAPRAGETFTGWVFYPVVQADVTSEPPTTGTVETAYSHQFTVTEGFPVSMWTWTSAAIPGLSFDPATGLLSGTPTQAGQFEANIAAEDELGNAIEYSTTVNIEPVQVTPPAGDMTPPVSDVTPPVGDVTLPVVHPASKTPLAQTGMTGFLGMGIASLLLMSAGGGVLLMRKKRTV